MHRGPKSTGRRRHAPQLGGPQSIPSTRPSLQPPPAELTSQSQAVVSPRRCGPQKPSPGCGPCPSISLQGACAHSAPAPKPGAGELSTCCGGQTLQGRPALRTASPPAQAPAAGVQAGPQAPLPPLTFQGAQQRLPARHAASALPAAAASTRRHTGPYHPPAARGGGRDPWAGRTAHPQPSGSWGGAPPRLSGGGAPPGGRGGLSAWPG